MLSAKSLSEFEIEWLPHVTDAGLNRLVDLLETGSPLLIHGAFTKACAMGCLATHIAWHHPATKNVRDEAGVLWLTRVAGLNPATSHVIREWDRCADYDYEMRQDLLALFREEQRRQVAASSQLPLAYLGTGPSIPDDLEGADGGSICDRILPI